MAAAAALQQIQDGLIRAAGHLRQPDFAGAAGGAARLAGGRQRLLELAQRVFVQLGPHEPAFAGKATALHRVDGLHLGAAALRDGHQLGRAAHLGDAAHRVHGHRAGLRRDLQARQQRVVGNFRVGVEDDPRIEQPLRVEQRLPLR